MVHRCKIFQTANLKLHVHYTCVLFPKLLVYVLPLVPKGDIALKYIGQLTSSGLCDHNSKLFDYTLEHAHADGAECLLLAL